MSSNAGRRRVYSFTCVIMADERERTKHVGRINLPAAVTRELWASQAALQAAACLLELLKDL